MSLTFFEAVWGSLDDLYGEIRRVDTPRSMFASSHEEADSLTRQVDTDGADAFFGVLPRTRKRGRAEDTVSHTSVLWLDLDAKQYGDSKARALSALNRLPIHPSIVVDSGHGYHAYFLLRKPVLFARAQKVMKALVETSGADPKATDAPRILRVPGTHNWKDGEPIPVRLLYFDPSRRHYISDFDTQTEAEVPTVIPVPKGAHEGDILSAFARAGISPGRQMGQLWMTNCPWHPDRTPSLGIYEKTQSFWCFGCGCWGDSLDVERWDKDGTVPPRK